METQSQENEKPLDVLDQIINELSGFLKDSWLSQLTEVRGKIQDSLVQLESEVEREKEERRAEIEGLRRDEIEPRKVEIQVLKSEIEREKEERRSEVEALWRDEIETRRVAIRVLKSEIEKQKEERKAEIEALWKDEIETRKVTIGRYRRGLESIGPISKLLVENLERDKSTAESNLKLMREKLDELEPELERRRFFAEGITKRIEQIEGQTKGIESEIVSLREGGDFWVEEIEALQAQKNALTPLVDKFWESLGKAESNISRIMKKIEEGRGDHGRWQAHIEELAARIKEAQAVFRETAEFPELSPPSDDQGALGRDLPVTVH